MRRVKTIKRVWVPLTVTAEGTYGGRWEERDAGEGWFHGWFPTANEDAHATDTVALVEFDDGRVEQFFPHHVRFISPPEAPSLPS